MSHKINLPNLHKVKYESDLVSILVERVNAPVVILASMQGCDPCIAMKPRFIDFARQNPQVFCLYICIDEFDNKAEIQQQVNNTFPTFIISLRKFRATIPASMEEMQKTLTQMMQDKRISNPLNLPPVREHRSIETQDSNPASQQVAADPHNDASLQCTDGVCKVPRGISTAQDASHNTAQVGVRGSVKPSTSGQQATTRELKDMHRSRNRSPARNYRKTHRSRSRSTDSSKTNSTTSIGDSKFYNSDTDTSSSGSLDTDELFEKLQQQKDSPPATPQINYQSQNSIQNAMPPEFQQRITAIAQARQNIEMWRNQPNITTDMQAQLMQQHAQLQACELKLKADMNRDERTKIIMDLQAKQDAAAQEHQRQLMLMQQQQNMMNGMMMGFQLAPGQRNPAYPVAPIGPMAPNMQQQNMQQQNMQQQNMQQQNMQQQNMQQQNMQQQNMHSNMGMRQQPSMNMSRQYTPNNQPNMAYQQPQMSNRPVPQYMSHTQGQQRPPQMMMSR